MSEKSANIYQTAFTNLFPQYSNKWNDFEDNIYRNVSEGKTDKQNLLIQKQKMLLIFGKLLNQQDVLENYIQTRISNLIPEINVNYDDLLANLPFQLLLDIWQNILVEESLAEFLNCDTRKNTALHIENILTTYFEPKDAKYIANFIEIGAVLYAFIIGKEYFPLSEINWSKQILKKIYVTNLNVICSSILNERFNEDLIQRIKTKDIHPVSLVFTKRDVLLPKLDEYRKTAIKDTLNVLAEQEDYTQYECETECKRCGKNFVKPIQLQLRSADEPMTTFYLCKYPKCPGRKLNNGRDYRWKEI